MRVVFLGSPPFATPILDRLLKKTPAHEVVGLVTPPDRPRGRGRAVVRSELAAAADEAGIPVIQPASTKTDEFTNALRALEPDVLVVASYGEILRTPVLEMCEHGALNVHGSLLPRWRGASPIQRAIAAGDEVTGVSIQRMVLALDAGDVILSKELPIGPEDTAADLFDRLAELGADAIVEALDAIAAGTATYTPQNPELVTLAPKLSKDDGQIDFERPADEIARHVRAMTTWPGARCTLEDGRDLVVLAARVAGDGHDEAPGTRLDRGSALVFAAAQGTAVEFTLVKPAGKGVMEGAAFLRGLRV
ncbi:Methionyl-tRNA formyltransferase [Planctomycetes bacterium Poly30]|uniref:Methionyl-tRNA formyltransferase n=1 Tax=Saltatorellus ferox TaxID=2528018 RepID=A0A518EKH9_9BACT|nr:Methionyl-tRNA formyltransferase [Planctomycetes bacterium Poly30]